MEGDLAPLFREDSHAIAIAVSTDDYGNVENLDHYPEIGSTQTITYVEDAYYIDKRTGEKCNENTPPEFYAYFIAQSYDVDYTICAYVIVPHSMSYRYGNLSYCQQTDWQRTAFISPFPCFTCLTQPMPLRKRLRSTISPL